MSAMNADTFGIIAVIGYGLAAILTVVGIIFYFTRHVRAVRDELTGKAAARAIESMQKGRSFLPVIEAAGRPPTGGSLHLRYGEDQTVRPSAEEVLAAGAPIDHAAPTGRVETPAACESVATPVAGAHAPGAESESATTLFGSASAASPSECETTLFAPASAAPPSESATTLFGSAPTASSSECETTLFGHPDTPPATETETTMLSSSDPADAAVSPEDRSRTEEGGAS